VQDEEKQILGPEKKGEQQPCNVMQHEQLYVRIRARADADHCAIYVTTAGSAVRASLDSVTKEQSPAPEKLLVLDGIEGCDDAIDLPGC
jgi:hypothetical protein